MLEEQDTLPERHFAAREEAALLGIAAETALVAELKPDIARARADLTPLEQAAAEAEAARRAQADHLSQLEGIASVARQRRARLEDLLEGIVAGGVVPAEMF